MIRFRVKNPDSEFNTEWQDEVLGDVKTQTAARQVSKLRQEYPDAEISVERLGVIPRKKRKMVRFKIKDRDTLFYSIIFPIEQKDEQMGKLHEKFPKAEITPEERNV